MEMLAPWAEPVLMTAAELEALPDDGWRYELVHGRLVRMTPTGYEQGRIAARLLEAVGVFVRTRDLGDILAPGTGFLLSNPRDADTVLAPDLAFVSALRVPDPASPDWRGYPRLAPDLVIEVASPSQGQSEMGAKAAVWLDAGCRLVWLVLPESRTVEVWRCGAIPRRLTAEDVLHGEEVLPGFTYPVARLFA